MKLILDTCQKTAFTFNNIIYKEKYGLSMGASLGPVLANIIMKECEQIIADNLVKEGTIKFCIRYVDDTLLLVKRQDVDKVLKVINGFDQNLKFTVDIRERNTTFLGFRNMPQWFNNFSKKHTHWTVH